MIKHGYWAVLSNLRPGLVSPPFLSSPGCGCLSHTERTQRSAIDSSSNYVQCNLLKLLTIVAESEPSGLEAVINALDHVKVRYSQWTSSKWRSWWL